MIKRQINHWSNLHWEVTYLRSTAADSSYRSHSTAGFLWHYVAEMSWMEVFTCCKHEDMWDAQQCQKIVMSLWSRSGTQQALILPFHEADESPRGEQLLSKYPHKLMKKVHPHADRQCTNHTCFCADTVRQMPSSTGSVTRWLCKACTACGYILLACPNQSDLELTCSSLGQRDPLHGYVRL